MVGQIVNRPVQMVHTLGEGETDAPFYDLSGTGIGPWLPCHLLVDNTGTPITSFGGSGGGALADLRPAAGNITTQDLVSASASGQNSVGIITGAPTANSFLQQAISGYSAVRAVLSGTWTGTLSFELSNDGGTSWIPASMRVSGTVYTVASATLNGDFLGDVAGCTHFRVRSSAAMTGTAVVQMTFSAAPGATQILNPLRLVDNVSGAQASIKLASTAPLATDPALVVALSPNAGLPSQAFDVQTTITRPANVTAYTALDSVGGALDLGVMGPNAKAILVTSAELELDIAAIPTGMTSFRLYLYSVTPPSALADNAAWTLSSGNGDRPSFLGYIDLGSPILLGATPYCRVDGVNAQFKLAGTHLFGYLVTNAGYTPGANSEVYKVTLHATAI